MKDDQRTPSSHDRSNSLCDLAARIRDEVEAGDAAVKRGLAHFIKAGELLSEAKLQLQHGKWSSWLAEHCTISERMAQRYMRLSDPDNRAVIEAKSDTVSDLTMRQALDLLAVKSESSEVVAPEEPEYLRFDGPDEPLDALSDKLWEWVGKLLKVSPMGLPLQDDLSFAGWVGYGRALALLWGRLKDTDAMKWWLGDWWNYGEDRGYPKQLKKETQQMRAKLLAYVEERGWKIPESSSPGNQVPEAELGATADDQASGARGAA